MLLHLGPIALAASAALTAAFPTVHAMPAPDQQVPIRSAPYRAQAAHGQPTAPGHGSRPAPPTRGSRAVMEVAHRGASAFAPENTIAAFHAAAAKGADLFELDVQQTKDHKLVVMHDTTLKRTTNAEKVFPSKRPWRVRDLTLAEIERLDAGSWFGRRFKGQRVPTLSAVLNSMNSSGLGMLLEVKSPSLYPGISRRLATELRANPDWLAGHRVIVQSFDSGFIKTFHGRLPSVPTGLLGTPSTRRLSAAARYADYINPPHGDVTASYVKSIHRHGMRVLPWTADDTATMRRLIAAGADGVLTNRPGTMRSSAG